MAMLILPKHKDDNEETPTQVSATPSLSETYQRPTLVLPRINSSLEDTYLRVADQDPNRVAKVVKLSKMLDEPEEFIDSNLEEAQKMATVPNADFWANYEKQYPVTSQFLKDERNMATAKDDLDELGEQEQWLGIVNQNPKYQDTLSAYTPNIIEQLIGMSNYQKAVNILTAVPHGLAAGTSQALSGLTQGFKLLDQLRQKYINQPLNISDPNQAERQKFYQNIQQGLEGYSQRHVDADEKQPFNEVGTSLSRAAQIIPPMGLSLAGQTIGIPAPVTFGTIAGGQYAREAEMEGATPEQQLAYGSIMGTVEALTEKIPLEGITKIFTGNAKSILIEYLKNIPEEYVQESVSQISSLLTKQFIYKPDQFLTNGELDWNKVGQGIAETLEAGKQGAEASAILGAFGLATRKILSSVARPKTIRDTEAKINQSKVDAEIYKATGQIISKSKYLDKLPDSARELIDANLKNGQLENIYVDSEAVISLMQSEKDPAAVIRDLGIEDQVQGAIETGKTFKIPYATWIEKTVKTPIYQKLEGDIKFSEDGLTLNQAAVIDERIKKNAEDEQKKANIDNTNYDSIYNDIHDKLIIAGRNEKEAKHDAQIFTARMIAEGAKRKVNPIELYMGIMSPEIQLNPNEYQDRNGKTWVKIDVSTFFQEGNSNNINIKAKPFPEDIPDLGRNPVKWQQLASEQLNKLIQKPIIAYDGTEVHLRPGATESFEDYLNHLIKGQDKENIVPDRVRALFLIEKTLDDPIAVVKQVNGRRLFLNLYEEQKTKTMHGIITEVDVDGTIRTVTSFVSKDTLKDKNKALRSLYSRIRSGENEDIEKNRGGLSGSSSTTYRSIQDSQSDVELHLPGQNIISQSNQKVKQDIRATVDINQNNSLITLFQKADASSFLHESAHLFLEDTFRFVKSGQADETYMKDWETLVDWLKVNEDQEQLTTEQQEKFAQGFETYLKEGKAPSEKLRNAFVAFRRWLTRIYGSITGLVPLSDDVRAVMDRMLATEDEIRAQEVTNGFLNDIVKESDVTPEEWAKYQDLRNKAHEMAVDTLLKEQMKELSQQHKEKLTKEREKYTKITEDEIANYDLYRAAEEVRTISGKEDIKSIAKKFHENPSVFEEGWRQRFEVIAELYGYSSGDQLAQEIVSAPNWKDKVKSTVDDYMKQQFPDLMDTTRIREEALNSVHNDFQLEALALERNYLSDLITKNNVNEIAKARNKEEAKITKMAAKKYAGEILNSKTYREATATISYFSSEKEAAIKEVKAIANKDSVKAAQYAEQRLLNHALALESMRVKEQVQKMENYLKKIQRKKVESFKAEEHFVQVASILNRFGFGHKEYDPAKKTETLADWVTRMDEVTNIVDIPDWLQDETIAMDYKKLTIDQFKDVVNSIKNIQHVANMEKKMFVLWNGIAKQEVINKLTDAANLSIAEKDKQREAIEPRKMDSLKKAAKKYNLDLLKITTILERLDGWKYGGDWNKTFWESVYKAANTESKLMNEYAEKLKQLYSLYSREELNTMSDKMQYHEELGDSCTKQRLIAMALNTGNELNLEKLTNTPPVGVTAEWNVDVLRSLFEKNLTEKDWQFVQGVWDTINELWPDIAKMNKELTGFEPEKVEAAPFAINTADGKTVYVEGGYYPLKQDSRHSTAAEVREALDSPLYTEQNPGWRAMTKTGHTKKRSNAQYAVSLDLSVIERHIRDVVHDLAFRPTIIDLNRLINDKQFTAMAKENMGAEGYSTLRNWVKSVAIGKTSQQAALSTLETVNQILRKKFTMAVILYKPTILIQNLANPLLFRGAIEGFGTKECLNAVFNRGIFDYGINSAINWKAAGKTRDFIYEKSAFMRDRAATPEYSISDLRNKLSGKDKAFYEFGISLIAYTDNLTAIPMWLEAYNKKLNETNNEFEAVKYADTLIDRTMGSGRKYDQAKIFNGSEFDKSLSMLYSFMNVQYNRFVRENGTLKATKNVPKYLAYVASNLIMFSITSTLLTGRWPDDDENPVAFWLREILMTPLAFFPGLREIAGVALDGILGVNSYGYKPNPVVSQLTNITQLPRQIADAVTSGEFDQQLSENIGRTASYTIGYPQMFNDWFFNAYDYFANGMEPEPRDLLRRRKQSDR